MSSRAPTYSRWHRTPSPACAPLSRCVLACRWWPVSTGRSNRHKSAAGRFLYVTPFHDRFVELYDMHFTRVRRFLDRLTGDPALAADIAQDTFVRLYHRGAPPDEPAAWLITVALNLLRNERSTAARRRTLLSAVRGEATVGDASRGPDETVEAADARQRVRAVLARLPERE